VGQTIEGVLRIEGILLHPYPRWVYASAGDGGVTMRSERAWRRILRECGGAGAGTRGGAGVGARWTRGARGGGVSPRGVRGCGRGETGRGKFIFSSHSFHENGGGSF
jgi:hypothetical protein